MIGRCQRFLRTGLFQRDGRFRDRLRANSRGHGRRLRQVIIPSSFAGEGIAGERHDLVFAHVLILERGGGIGGIHGHVVSIDHSGNLVFCR